MSEKDEAMARWNLAWDHYQDAMGELNKHWQPRGSGIIPQKALDNVEAAKKEADSANTARAGFGQATELASATRRAAAKSFEFLFKKFASGI